RGTTADAPARVADAVATAITAAAASCTTWAGCPGTGRATCTWSTPDTAARTAACTSVPTCPTSLRRAATTPTGSSLGPCASSWRTAYPTGRPPGTCGATTVSSSPSPPCKTGSRRRGKKAVAQAETGYLDWALADFSGYLAA